MSVNHSFKVRENTNYNRLKLHIMHASDSVLDMPWSGFPLVDEIVFHAGKFNSCTQGTCTHPWRPK